MTQTLNNLASKLTIGNNVQKKSEGEQLQQYRGNIKNKLK